MVYYLEWMGCSERGPYLESYFSGENDLDFALCGLAGVLADYNMVQLVFLLCEVI